MKKILLVTMILALLVLSGSLAGAVAVPTIQIDDTQEAVPTVTLSNFSTNSPVTSSGFEWVAISGFLPNLGTINPKGAYLVEPPFTSTVSDFAIFGSDAGNFVVGFASDGATNINFTIQGMDFHFDTFAQALNTFEGLFPLATTFTLGETGNYQNLFPNDVNTLLIQAKSDISEIPLPGALVLLGSGLLGLGAYARRKRTQA